MICQRCLQDAKFVIPTYRQLFDEVSGVETKVGLEYWCILCIQNESDDNSSSDSSDGGSSIGVSVSDGKPK